MHQRFNDSCSETTYSPEEMLAMVLEKAKSSAESFAGNFFTLLQIKYLIFVQLKMKFLTV